jgi:hypothetical protein
MSTRKVHGGEMIRDVEQIAEVYVGVRAFEVWRDADAAAATQARGQALLDESRILIDPRSGKHLQAITLLHEMFHAAFEQSPLTAGKAVKDAQVDVDDALEEKLCTWLEFLVPQLYRDNSKLFEQLLA